MIVYELIVVRFLLRDAMHTRDLYCRPKYVRLSVTLVDCMQTAEDIVKLLSRPGSRVILVFDPERRYPIPRGTHSAEAQNTWGGEIFRLDA